jgi:hypothetical protein
MVEWTSLTQIERKQQLYAAETYFRESLADFAEILGDDADAAVRQCALLMVKPDGVAARKLRAALDFLADHGFSVLAVQWAGLAGKTWRELWRYQLNAATLDRLLVNDVVLDGEGLLMLLRRDGSPEDLPAAVLLTELKGPADVSRQDEHCLRKRLNQPNRVFSLVHVANEPADVIRELGVLLDRPARQRAFAAYAAGVLPEADRAVLHRALERDAEPPRDLDPVRAAERVRDAVAGAADTPAKHAVLATAAAVSRGERIRWRPFAAALATLGVDVAHWDLATIGASSIHYDEPGLIKTIENVDPALWQAQLAPLRG